MADAHLARGDEHLVASDLWLGELGDLGPLRSGEHECLHDSPLLAVENRLQSIAAVDKGASVVANGAARRAATTEVAATDGTGVTW